MLKAVCILLFIGLAASESSVSSVVSRILSQAKNSRSRSPVIFVVNSRALQDSSSVEAPAMHQSSEESGLSMLNMILAQLQKSRSKPAPNRYRARPDRLQVPTNRNKKGQQFPVYKSLLSLRNSLRCGARDECKNECEELPKKKQKKKCIIKCEIQYECEEEEEEPKCEDGDDGCGDDPKDDNVSTKAPPYSAETQRECPRC